MKKRYLSKLGDVYCVEIDNKYKSFFQYVANDISQLNSSVIRVFKTRYTIEDFPNIDDIINDDVIFYAHTIIQVGIINGVWYKVNKSNCQTNTKVNSIVWVTNDNDQFYISPMILLNKLFPFFNWSLWTISSYTLLCYRYLKWLSNKVEYGTILPTDQIIDRIKFGYYTITSIAFNVIKRHPFPFVDSYVKQSIEDVARYYHFHGEEPVREIRIENGKTYLMTRENPQSDIFRMRTKSFSDTNWKYHEFIEEDEFENIWQNISKE